LGCHDFPFEIIADHPGLVRPDPEHFHRMIVGSLLGLAEAVLEDKEILSDRTLMPATRR
jgi:hypothetical protein